MSQLENTLIREEGFKYLFGNWKLPNLKILDIGGCYVSDAVLSSMASWDLPKLKQLNIKEGMSVLTGQGF